MKTITQNFNNAFVFYYLFKGAITPVPPVPLAPFNNSTNISLTPMVKMEYFTDYRIFIIFQAAGIMSLPYSVY